jgi:hypothetical protein
MQCYKEMDLLIVLIDMNRVSNPCKLDSWDGVMTHGMGWHANGQKFHPMDADVMLWRQHYSPTQLAQLLDFSTYLVTTHKRVSRR